MTVGEVRTSGLRPLVVTTPRVAGEAPAVDEHEHVELGVLSPPADGGVL